MKILTYTLKLALAGFIALAISGSAGAQETTSAKADSPEVIVVVNGESVTAKDLANLLVSVHQTIPAEKRAEFNYRSLVTKLVNDRLIIQEATAMGMDQEAMIVTPIEKFRMSEAVSAFISEAYNPVIEVTDEDIQSRFEKNYKRAQIRTIAINTIEEAEEVYRAISNGASMDSIAKVRSFDSKAATGGLHKPKFWKDMLVELRLQTGKLEVGELSQPFMYENAYMVLRLEKTEEASHEVFGHAEDGIRRSLILDHRKRVWEALIDSLQTLYPVITNSETLTRIQADSGVVLSGSFTNESDAPLLSIEGMPSIDESRFRKDLSHKAMTAGEEGFVAQLENTIAETAENYLLEAAAKKNGYLERPQIVDAVTKMQDSLLVEKYLQENIATQITFDDEKLRSIYDEYDGQWQLPGDVRLGVLLCADKKNSQEALEMLRDGANFDYVSNRLGIENDYNIKAEEWRKPSSLPSDLATKIEDLPVGGFADGMYELPDGVAIFQLTARRDGRVRTFDEVVSNLRNIHFQREFNQLMDNLLDTLKERSTIEMHEDRIAKFLEG